MSLQADALFSFANIPKQLARLTPRIWITASITIALSATAFLTLHFKSPQTVAPQVIAVAFSPDAKVVAAGLQNGTIRVWQTKSWQPVHSFRVEDGGLNTLTFSPDSKRIAIAGRSLSLWTTAPWQEWKRLGISGAVYGTARFDSSGERVASVNASEQIEIWNVQTATRLRSLCCMALYGDLAFSPDDRALAAAGHWPRIWDIATARVRFRLVQTRGPTFAAVQFRSDGELLATGSQDGIARIWNAATGSLVSASPARQSYIETIAFQPQGPHVAYGVRNGEIWLWNLSTQHQQRITESSTSNVAFSADGQRLAFGTLGAVHIWNIDPSRELTALKFPPS